MEQFRVKHKKMYIVSLFSIRLDTHQVLPTMGSGTNSEPIAPAAIAQVEPLQADLRLAAADVCAV